MEKNTALARAVRMRAMWFLFLSLSPFLPPLTLSHSFLPIRPSPSPSFRTLQIPHTTATFNIPPSHTAPPCVRILHVYKRRRSPTREHSIASLNATTPTCGHARSTHGAHTAKASTRTYSRACKTVACKTERGYTRGESCFRPSK